MSTTPDTTVVVVEERRRRFPVPLVAAVAGAALLGGSTFALWSASENLGGGSITAGDLDLTMVGDPTYYDVSADRNDRGTGIPGTGIQAHLVDIKDWRIVPGDKVALVYDVDVTLEGDNMVASLSVTPEEGDDLTIEGMTYSYAIYKSLSTLVPETELGEDEDVLLYLAAPEIDATVGSDAGGDPLVHPMLTGTETYTVVIFGTFDEDQVDTLDSAKAVDALTGLSITLTQVRDVGEVFE